MTAPADYRHIPEILDAITGITPVPGRDVQLIRPGPKYRLRELGCGDEGATDRLESRDSEADVATISLAQATASRTNRAHRTRIYRTPTY